MSGRVNGLIKVEWDCKLRAYCMVRGEDPLSSRWVFSVTRKRLLLMIFQNFLKTLY